MKRFLISCAVWTGRGLGWVLLAIMLSIFYLLEALGPPRRSGHVPPVWTGAAPTKAPPKPGDMRVFDQDACPKCGVIGHHCPNFVPPPEDKGCPGCADCGKTHPKWPDGVREMVDGDGATRAWAMIELTGDTDGRIAEGLINLYHTERNAMEALTVAFIAGMLYGRDQPHA